MSAQCKDEIEIFVTETSGISRRHECVRVGIPCPKGIFFDPDELRLLNGDNEVQPLQSTVLKKWNDGSLKWLLVDFFATVPASERAVYRLIRREDSIPKVISPVIITEGTESWRISTGTCEFIVDTKVFCPFTSISVNKAELLASGGSSCMLGVEGERLTPFVDSVVVESKGPLRSILRLEGRFGPERISSPRYDCRIHFFAGSSHLVMEFTLLNHRAASHHDGLWDLGDCGSLLFKDLLLEFALADARNYQIFCSPEPGTPPCQCEPSAPGMRIYQESSGGEQWNSPVHRTRDGSVRLRFNGYEMRDGDKIVSTGKRATPVVWYGKGEIGLSAVMPHFWQEFPKAFTVKSDCMTVELYPGCAPDLHELQGGEQKTTTVHLDFATSPGGLAWACSPLVAAPSPLAYLNSGIFTDLPPITGESEGADLVDQFITVDDLINKREIVDEYGWRNFGDLYADHEAVYHKAQTPFVSHYNNQYDGISGAYRKYFATGDPRWGALASDMARHVCDIDINHTDQDREEYNRGLFWHTDHYVDAGLSTHRSCSREHLRVKDPRFCGGGPGAEHCYTSGLMYHYFQTGDPAFSKVVTDMADWVLRSLKGPPVMLAVLKKSLRHVSMLRSTGKGVRPVFPQYPLTRGTGNAITACLDAYEVSGDIKYLAEVEELIKGALHPDDEIDARNLLDAELAWSYTVLLNAVAKYLYKKTELAQIDAAYHYARASLLAYSEWMLIHEYPYLDKPGILEYPNETWAAQDLRKSVIFYHASHFCSSERKAAYLERARFFFNAAEHQLKKQTTSHFTRPVVLMLQNGWVGARLFSNTTMKTLNGSDRNEVAHVSGPATPFLTVGAVVSRIVSELLNALRNTSIKREMAWLKARIRK